MDGLDAPKNLPPSGYAERVVGVTGPQTGVVDDDARIAQSRASKARDGQGYLTPNRLGPAADRPAGAPPMVGARPQPAADSRACPGFQIDAKPGQLLAPLHIPVTPLPCL